MKQLRFWGFLPAFCLLTLPLTAQTYELEIGSGVGGLGAVADVGLIISTDVELQGVQFSFEWDEVNGIGVALSVDVPGPLDDADVVAMRVGDNDGAGKQFMVMGVVMDNDGSGEVIDPGMDQRVATASIQCANNEGTFPITLVDGKYAMVGTEPTLDHPDHRRPLLVGDRVEVLRRLFGASHFGVDRMRVLERVQREGRGSMVLEIEPHLPVRSPVVDDGEGHPGRERLV